MNYEMHPLMMFQILEAWNNRPVDTTDVIGVILGTCTGSTVSLQEAYYLHHTLEESSLEIQCDLLSVKTILSLSHVLHPDYQIVGWFSTYTNLSEIHRIIHTSFSQQFDQNNLLLLTVDVTLQQHKLQPTLYTNQNTFALIPSGEDDDSATTTTTTTTAAPVDGLIPSQDVMLTSFAVQNLRTVIPTQERLALHEMIYGNQHPSAGYSEDRLDTPVALKANVESVRTALVNDLGEGIAASAAYVDGVLNGTIALDEATAKALTLLVTNTPVLDQSSSQNVFASSLDDLTLFSHLASLTKQVVAQNVTEPKIQ